MGLLGNGFRQNLTGKLFGATALDGSNPSVHEYRWKRTAAMRNTTAGEGISNDTAGFPMGYVMKGWQLPQKAGMISARMHDLRITPTGFGVGGVTSPGEAGISIAFADAFGQLIASGIGSASLTVTTNAPLLTASIGGTGSATATITGNPSILGALSSGQGSTAITITFSPATIYPLNDASPLRTGAATLTVNGSMIPYAKGHMTGTTADLGLTVAGITNAVWTAPLAAYQGDGTAGKALSAASSGGVDYQALGVAVWSSVSRTLTSGSGTAPTTDEIVAAIEAAVVPVNVAKVNAVPVSGSGTSGDPWRAA